MKKENILAVLGANIRRFRNRSGLSQFELAEKINISIPFLSDIETGKTWVSPTTLTKLSEAFGLEIYELFKPEQTLSGNAVLLLKKYNEDAHRLLDKLHTNYLVQAGKRH